MKFLKYLFPLMFFLGCAMPLQEYNYRGNVPEPNSVDSSLAMNFSTSLAKECGLRIVAQSKPTGTERVDEIFSVELRLEESNEIYITVLTLESVRMLAIRIGGDIELPRAKEIARCSKALYERRYPGSELKAFTRYGGLFGP